MTPGIDDEGVANVGAGRACVFAAIAARDDSASVPGAEKAEPAPRSKETTAAMPHASATPATSASASAKGSSSRKRYVCKIVGCTKSRQGSCQGMCVAHFYTHGSSLPSGGSTTGGGSTKGSAGSMSRSRVSDRRGRSYDLCAMAGCCCNVAISTLASRREPALCIMHNSRFKYLQGLLFKAEHLTLINELDARGRQQPNKKQKCSGVEDEDRRERKENKNEGSALLLTEETQHELAMYLSVARDARRRYDSECKMSRRRRRAIEKQKAREERRRAAAKAAENDRGDAVSADADEGARVPASLARRIVENIRQQMIDDEEEGGTVPNGGADDDNSVLKIYDAVAREAKVLLEERDQKNEGDEGKIRNKEDKRKDDDDDNDGGGSSSSEESDYLHDDAWKGWNTTSGPDADGPAAMDWDKRGRLTGEGRDRIFDHWNVNLIDDLVGWATSQRSDARHIEGDPERSGVAEAADYDSRLYDLSHIPAPPPPPSRLMFLAKRATELACRGYTTAACRTSTTDPPVADSDAERVRQCPRSREKVPEDKEEPDRSTGCLQGAFRALDDSALVAAGMAVENLLVAALLPLAEAHAKRCHRLGRERRGASDDGDAPVPQGGGGAAEVEGNVRPLGGAPPTTEPFEAWTLPPVEAILELAKDPLTDRSAIERFLPSARPP